MILTDVVCLEGENCCGGFSSGSGIDGLTMNIRFQRIHACSGYTNLVASNAKSRQASGLRLALTPILYSSEDEELSLAEAPASAAESEGI